MAVKFTEVQPDRTISIHDLMAQRNKKTLPKSEDTYLFVLGRVTKKHKVFHPIHFRYTPVSFIRIENFRSWLHSRYIGNYIVKFLVTNFPEPHDVQSVGIVKITRIHPPSYVGVV